MAFELEVLVGHLYVVGGRAISTTPPGALVEVAPKKAARGRELDTFFVLVLPSGQTPAPTTFYAQMAQMAAERFFAQTGSITAALRAVLTDLNQNLFDHNESGRKHYEANMICCVLHGSELFVARIGAAVLILQHEGQTKTYPEDLRDDEALYTPPLGVQPIPDIKMTRYEVGPHTRIALGDANLADFELERATQAMVAQDLEQVLEAYKEIVLDRISMMVAEFVPPDEPAPVPVAIGESSAAIATELAAARARAKTATQETAAVARGTPPPPRERRRGALQQGLKRFIAAVASGGAAFFALLGRLLDAALPQSESGKPSWLATPTGRVSIFIIPFLIILMVVLAWTAGVGDTQFEQCLQRAQSTANLARSIDSSDRQGTLAAWEAVLQVVRSCEQIRPTQDPSLVALRGEGQNVIDRINRITRRGAIPIITLPAGSEIRSLALQGLDLYVLDSAVGLVYRVRLSPDGLSAAGTDAITSMRNGATVDGLPIGTLIDIAFDENMNAIAALDSNGVLVRCPPRFILECDATRVLAAETWGNPIAIQLWQGRLYVLDIGVGQIWRYDSAGNSFPNSPTDYFRGQVRPSNMANVVDFEISTDGTVFILYNDGVMARYFGGQPQSFIFSDFPEGQDLQSATVQRMYLNDGAIDTGFLIISRPTRTIYQTTSAGTFIASYRVVEENLLAGMTDVSYEPDGGIIYVASGNAILAIPTED